MKTCSRRGNGCDEGKRRKFSEDEAKRRSKVLRCEKRSEKKGAKTSLLHKTVV